MSEFISYQLIHPLDSAGKKGSVSRYPKKSLESNDDREKIYSDQHKIDGAFFVIDISISNSEQ